MVERAGIRGCTGERRAEPGKVLFDADYDTGGFDYGIGLAAFP